MTVHVKRIKGHVLQVAQIAQLAEASHPFFEVGLSLAGAGHGLAKEGMPYGHIDVHPADPLAMGTDLILIRFGGWLLVGHQRR